MQRFRHSKNGMIHDVEGIYVLFVDAMDAKALANDEDCPKPHKTTTRATTMKRYKHENSGLVTDENGGYVRWFDHAAALFKQDQQHIEDRVIFNDEIKRLKDEIERIKNANVARLNVVVQHKCEEIIERRDKAIVERNGKIERRNRIIENCDDEIVRLRKKCAEVEQHETECISHFNTIKARNIEIEILELSVKKRDEMLIKYEEIIARRDKVIADQKQVIADYVSVAKQHYLGLRGFLKCNDTK